VAVWIEPCLSVPPSIRPMLPVGELVLSSAVSVTHRNAAKSERSSTVVECDGQAGKPMGEGRRRPASCLPCHAPNQGVKVLLRLGGANCARFGRAPVPEMTSVVSACVINAHRRGTIL
jgi:hypothetical protein